MDKGIIMTKFQKYIAKVIPTGEAENALSEREESFSSSSSSKSKSKGSFLGPSASLT